MFLKVQWSPVLIPFQNGENKTILKNLEQQPKSVIKQKPNWYTSYAELSKNFGRTYKGLTEIAASIEH